MTNLTKGSTIKIVGDTFKADPHNLPIGSIHKVLDIHDAVRFDEFPPHIKLAFLFEGKEPFDLPKRAFVRYGTREDEFANIVLEDLEVVDGLEVDSTQDYSSTPLSEVSDGDTVEMLEDDYCDAFEGGQKFEVFRDSDGELSFIDNDGDARSLDGKEFRKI